MNQSAPNRGLSNGHFAHGIARAGNPCDDEPGEDQPRHRCLVEEATPKETDPWKV